MKCEKVQEILLDHIRGMTDSGTHDEICEHIRDCADCRKALEELTPMAELYRAVKGEEMQTTEEHVQDLVKMAHAMKPRKAKAWRWADKAAFARSWGSKPLVPALVAVGLLIVAGVLTYWQRAPEQACRIPPQIVKGLPWQGTGGINGQEWFDTSRQVWHFWFYTHVPTSVLLDFIKNNTAENLNKLLESIDAGDIRTSPENAALLVRAFFSDVRKQVGSFGFNAEQIEVRFEQGLHEAIESSTQPELLFRIGFFENEEGVKIKIEHPES